jgi:LysM repeat protein
VSNGDTLWSISRRYGLSVADLKTVNGFKADTILPGQVILIP